MSVLTLTRIAIAILNHSWKND